MRLGLSEKLRCDMGKVRSPWCDGVARKQDTDLFLAHVDPEFNQFVQPLIGRLIPILLNVRSPKSLTENAAVTIGRIALVAPQPVAPHLEAFAQQW